MSYAGFGDTVVGTFGSGSSGKGVSTGQPLGPIDPLDPIGSLMAQAQAYYVTMNSALALGQQAASRADVESGKCDSKAKATAAGVKASVLDSVRLVNEAWARLQGNPNQSNFTQLRQRVALLQSETNDLNSLLATCKGGGGGGGYVKPIAPPSPVLPVAPLEEKRGFFDSIPTTAWYVAGAGAAAIGAFWFVKRKKAAS